MDIKNSHNENKKGWDAVSPHWQKGEWITQNWNKCHTNPSLVFNEQELNFFNNIKDKNICVLGSGDNLSVFALAGLGAKVTSIDFSDKQLEIAEKRAKEIYLEINFIQEDVINLKSIENNTFDFVYTAEGVAVWISDLNKHYSEAIRILKPNGLFIINEFHPFRYIWKPQPNKLEMEISYNNNGPHIYDRSEEVTGTKPGTFTSYEYHWTISDRVNSLIKNNCELILLEELGGERERSWECPKVVGLPENLFLVGKKKL